MFSLRGRKKGNYPYACARVKAKKSLLLENEIYPKLLIMDLSEIGRFLGETQYKEEMSELASRYDGVNLIELGMSRNLARMNTQVLGFCAGNLHDMVEKYLGRWDIWNVKTILRGKFYGASAEEIQEDIVAAGQMSDDYLNYLISLATINDVLDDVRKKGNLPIPDEVKAQFDTTGTLAPIEDFLDKLFYERLIGCVECKTGPEKLLMTFLRKEVDVANLMTLLKLKREGVELDKIGNYFIEGGQELSVKELTRLAGLESFEATIGELSKLSFYEEIKEALEKVKAKGSLTYVALALQRHLATQSQKFSHVYPLSVLPVIDYMIRKKIEVDNIRIIARGKESGLDIDHIKELLVV
jgi:V/A-type H+/Na+-transporting ATPase subunit C